VSFSRRLKLDAGSVRDPALIREALTATEAEGSTAMWDALVAGASLAQAGDSRALAIVFTDGIDTYSYLNEKKALACLDRSNYEPTGVRRDDGWHEVKVGVKDGRGDVRARPGYFAGSR